MRRRHKTEYLIVHCSWTTASQNIGVEEIREWHKKKGWGDIGYHFVIDRFGIIYRGRAEHLQGAHAKGYNNKSIGICLVGGKKLRVRKDEENFNKEQYRALARLVFSLSLKYPKAVVRGHRDFSSKTCPVIEPLKLGDIK